MDISQELLDQIIAHAREIPDQEVCGVVAVEDASPGRAVKVYRARNKHASDLKFEIEPKELLALWNEIQREGWEVGAIYHSHVRSKPRPSQTDILFSREWPGVEWIIVGLVGTSAPDVHSYLIEKGVVREVEIGQVAV